MKKCKEILIGVEILNQVGDMPEEINIITFDSRSVGKGDVFVALVGTTVDGHDYIEGAITQGASVIVCEKIPEKINAKVHYIQVKDSAKVLGIIASNFYNHPTQKLKLIGITGTNGKTTIATLLYRLFIKAGFSAGLISTIENYINDKIIPTKHTTPDVITLNELFNEMVQAGCEYCFMEVSSHAIVQQRISSLTFGGAVFTNITHDHLDYHKTFKEYLYAKKQFFDDLPESAFALTNNDDKNGPVMLQNTKAIKKTYGLKSMADFKCKIAEIHFTGNLLEIDGTGIWSHLVGEFNAYNILAIYATSRLLGMNKDDSLTIISSLKEVSGRFECIRSKEGVTAIVDYAHTPDALDNLLRTVQKIRKEGEQIITVVGAGGDRDKTKRPVMAKVSLDYSDKVILTSDNPRTEDPEKIIEDMMKGVETDKSGNVLNIVDRKQAIKTACIMAHKGDIIVVAGKGHETYQEVNGVRSHFDDKEVVEEQFSIVGIIDKTIKN